MGLTIPPKSKSSGYQGPQGNMDIGEWMSMQEDIRKSKEHQLGPQAPSYDSVMKQIKAQERGTFNQEHYGLWKRFLKFLNL